MSEITNWDPKAPLRFPLRPVYEWFNGTYEGMLLSVTLDPLVVERTTERQGRPENDLGLQILNAGFSWQVPENPVDLSNVPKARLDKATKCCQVIASGDMGRLRRE